MDELTKRIQDAVCECSIDDWMNCSNNLTSLNVFMPDNVFNKINQIAMALESEPGLLLRTVLYGLILDGVKRNQEKRNANLT
jgi:hypothetical protein